MTQLFEVKINGAVVEIKSANISEEMNRFYDVAFFEMKEEPALESEVLITFGARTFSGFVYNTSKISKMLFRVECRTEGAKLTEPYSSFTEGFDDADTSHALCALYEAQSDILINITAGDLSFGGSYERKGTMLSALSNIAHVTGAEFWDDGSSIQIQPNKAITEDGLEVPPSDIFDFVASTRTVYNRGVGFITVRNGGSETNDVISKNAIYAEVDECTGELFVYPNPNGLMEYSNGISPLNETSVDRLETVGMLDQDLIRLDGAIKSIDSVTLNGAAVSDYNFEQGHNVIYFNSLKRGSLTVSYTAYAYSGYANISQTTIGRFITFDMFYLDQVLMFQGFLSADCDGNVSTDGDMTCIVPSEMLYNAGFDVWTLGGDPEFIFYNKNVQISRAVTSVAGAYISTESANLEAFPGGYRYRTRYPLSTALGLRSNGVDVGYTTSQDGDDYYFEVNQYYPKVEVSYETSGVKHTVKFPEIPDGLIVMVVKNANTEQVCEYDLDTGMPCELNQAYPINVADVVGMEVTEVFGKTLNYTLPDNSVGSSVVDAFGVMQIWVSMNGDYVVNTTSLKSRTQIVLSVNT